jgi:acetyl esterase/lipase
VLKQFIAIMVSGLFATAVQGQQQQQLDPITKWATIAEYEDAVQLNVIYQRANNLDLRLDVITIGSPSVRRPTLIYFHGGGWVEGVKESTIFSVLPYLARGMNTVNVEYRTAAESLAPAAVEDTRCALHWVYDHAAEYGFDTSKIVVSGHSAGGHLALMTGLLRPENGFDNSCQRSGVAWGLSKIQEIKVAAIVNFFGPTDVTKLIEGPTTRYFAVRWFGSLPNRQELAKQVSALEYVHRDSPPTITIMGDMDPIVPYSQGVSLHEVLDHAGVPNQLVTIHGGGHGSTPPNAWTREQNLYAQEEVFSFLEKQGVLSPNH